MREKGIFEKVFGSEERNEIKVFENAEFGEIRTVTIDDEPWLVGKDVAVALGYENPQKALRDHIEIDDKKMGEQNVTPYIMDSLGRKQYPIFINESGLYALIFGSKLKSAKRFKHWVTSEVLPTLRGTGTYSMEPETMAQTVTVTETVQTEIENYEIFLEAARIMATIPNSQQYVINCLRHVIPDIDETRIKQKVTKAKRVPDKRNNNYFRLGVDIDTEKLLVTMCEKDLSVHEVARRAQVCVNTVEGWIAGRHKPVLQNRINLCRALGENENFLTPRRQRRKK